jgi:predicted ATP-dependent endonuclease of OLD family
VNIAFVDIQNFRKLKSCRVELAPQETVFVGANNSGKTSAMDSMILFLKKSRRKDIATTDFTLSNWSDINGLGKQWIDADEATGPDLSLEQWLPYLPSLDVWLDATDADLHYVIQLLPTLDWTPEQKLGVRLVLAPKDVEQLYKDYRTAYQAARDIEPSGATGEPTALSLWPESMRIFLDRQLHTHFTVQAYILDPSKCAEPVDGVVTPQALPPNSEPMDREPFDGLLKIDVISAQRGFSDPKTEGASYSGFSSLSTQLRHYFTKHLDPSDSPDASDIDALKAIEAARAVFDDKLKTSFAPAIGELESLNYPGFSDPQISLTSSISTVDSLDHDTAVQFHVSPPHGDGIALSLPEKYNGLGYQNLISMVFNLIRFRDEWMRVGKASKSLDTEDKIIEPLHVVLVEEPEAHLHAQVQQVFIKKAYAVLRKHQDLHDSQLNTQLVVSTHSSHIAHELDFGCLRYFRREPAAKKGQVPLATVVNLSKTFGDGDDTAKFAKRYLKTTHCDLFFADAAILVEGAAERMLVPHFIRNHAPVLDQSYISLLEIGGSHAHRLRPLLETLGLVSLIITDVDAIGASTTGKVPPERGKDYRTGNTTLKTWLPAKQALDDLLACTEEDKQSETGRIRVAYQCPITLPFNGDGTTEEAIPYTFEDSLALANPRLFRGFSSPTGLLKKLKEALDKDTLAEASKAMFNNLEAGSKAGMALDLLFLTDPKDLAPPTYIAEGLQWLEKRLAERKQDFLVAGTAEEKDA